MKFILNSRNIQGVVKISKDVAKHFFFEKSILIESNQMIMKAKQIKDFAATLKRDTYGSTLQRQQTPKWSWKKSNEIWKIWINGLVVWTSERFLANHITAAEPIWRAVSPHPRAAVIRFWPVSESSSSIPTLPSQKSLQYPLWHFLWCEWGRTWLRPIMVAYCFCQRHLIQCPRPHRMAGYLCLRRARAVGTCLAR